MRLSKDLANLLKLGDFRLTNLVSKVSLVFDTGGLVASYTIRARLLLKDIWGITGQQCDDPLIEALRKQFIERHSCLFCPW